MNDAAVHMQSGSTWGQKSECQKGMPPPTSGASLGDWHWLWQCRLRSSPNSPPAPRHPPPPHLHQPVTWPLACEAGSMKPTIRFSCLPAAPAIVMLVLSTHASSITSPPPSPPSPSSPPFSLCCHKLDVDCKLSSRRQKVDVRISSASVCSRLTKNRVNYLEKLFLDTIHSIKETILQYWKLTACASIKETDTCLAPLTSVTEVSCLAIDAIIAVTAAAAAVTEDATLSSLHSNYKEKANRPD